MTDLEVDGFNDASIAFSPDGRQLVIGGLAEIVFFQVGTWQRVKQIPRQAGDPLFAFSPDGSIFACADTTDTIRILDARTLKELCQLDTPEWTYLSCLRFTPDGSTLLAGTERLEVHVWQLADLQQSLNHIHLGWPEDRFRSADVGEPAMFSDLIYVRDRRTTSTVRALESQAQELFQQGAYTEAAAQLQEAAELSPLDPRLPFHVPILFVLGDDLPAYQRYCRWMLGIHRHTRDAERLARAAMHSCIVAPSRENLNIAVECARLSTDIDPQRQLMRLFEVAQALAEYRAGNYREAISWSHRVLQLPSIFWASHPLARTVRSLARIQLQEDADEVQAELDIVRAALDQGAQKYANGSIELGNIEYLICRVLYFEARRDLERWQVAATAGQLGTESRP